VEAGTAANRTQLAQFAWQEFIALNWPSSYGDDGTIRGNPSSNPALTFASVTTQTAQPLVWQTYKHRVELFPDNFAGYNSNFDTPPRYDYAQVSGGETFACTATGTDPNSPPLSQLNSSNGHADIFNNLDETTEINLATMFVQTDPAAPPPTGSYMADNNPGRRFIYEAKANRTMFDYVASNTLYDPATRWPVAEHTLQEVNTGNIGGVAPCPVNPGGSPVICFPPGVQGEAEGTIEIKATWRQLSQVEYNSGRFLVAPIIRYFNYDQTDLSKFCYNLVEASATATSLPYGLVGLHIIHKTTNFPTFVFATFEQVDALDDSVPNNQLFFLNRNSGIVNPDRQDINSRAHAIEDDIELVNSQVHEAIRGLNARSVWQYYKLIGVQGTASNFNQNIDYYLANIATETNEALRSFAGTLDGTNGTTNPSQTNISKVDDTGETVTYIGGGCKGCHGNAQRGVPMPGNPSVVGSFDFSFITANAPFDGVPDAVNQALLKKR
jgi:hypothetical protein